ncbi:MAG: flagellar brake domain-containing protein [Lachnospiraceae bacterium]|nr:flagellar brake domain-containing protein [Lachnospiraceae bacterium]
MNKSNLIETGNRLELRKIRHIKTAEEITYVSRFLYQESADEAVIEMPAKEGALVALEPGTAFLVCFYTNKGLYQCRVQVVSRRYEDKLPVAVIKFRSEFERLQRRQYYRIECLLNMEFCVPKEAELERLLWEKSSFHEQVIQEQTTPEEEQEEETGTPVNFYTGIALDLSGGGVRFNSGYQAAEGEVIAMKIAFLEQDVLKQQLLFAKVLAVYPVPNRTGLYEHRVQFVHITNAERESIIRYIFFEERKRRKKEAGGD